MLLETELRKLLRIVWKADIIWTEPSRGGSVGSADCTLPLPFGWLPLELKVWDSRFQAGSLQMHSDVRPAQRRYHLRAALADQKTAFLVAQKTELNSRLFVFPGGLVAATDSWVTASVMTQVGWEADPAPALNDSMLRIFSSGDFWRGL